jgi:hypothetical protein
MQPVGGLIIQVLLFQGVYEPVLNTQLLLPTLTVSFVGELPPLYVSQREATLVILIVLMYTVATSP